MRVGEGNGSHRPSLPLRRRRRRNIILASENIFNGRGEVLGPREGLSVPLLLEISEDLGSVPELPHLSMLELRADENAFS